MAQLVPVHAINLIKMFTNDPHFKMFELNLFNPAKPLPILASVYDLRIKTNNKQIDAKYTAARYLTSLADHNGIDGLLAKIARDDLDMDRDGKPVAPFKTKLSIRNRYYTYIIFRLVNKNIQFSADRAPFSIGEDALDPAAYFNPRKVDATGATVPLGGYREGCKIAYFIADGEATYPHGGSGYTDSFNFHLDLIDKDGNGADSFIPILIDPDVRYPGGSGEP